MFNRVKIGSKRNFISKFTSKLNTLKVLKTLIIKYKVSHWWGGRKVPKKVSRFFLNGPLVFGRTHIFEAIRKMIVKVGKPRGESISNKIFIFFAKVRDGLSSNDIFFFTSFTSFFLFFFFFPFLKMDSNRFHDKGWIKFSFI